MTLFDASGDMIEPFAVIVTFTSGAKKYAMGQADTFEQFEAMVREQMPAGEIIEITEVKPKVKL